MQKLNELLASAKVATGVATGTTSVGVGTMLDLIPDDIGKLATLVGIILSSVLIYTHWRKGRIEYAKSQLEVELLRKQLEDYND